MRRLAQFFCLIMIMALLLAACGGDEAPPTSTPGDTAQNTPSAQEGKTFRVGVVQHVSHPALDAARNGIKDTLSKSGLKLEILEKNAGGDVPALVNIMEGLVDDQVDLVMVIGTPALQAANSALAGTGIPIVFNSVANPYAALPDVIKSESDHRGITGVQAAPPVGPAFDLIEEIQPGSKKVGIVWTSNEANSQAVTKLVKEYAGKKSVEIAESTVTKADEVLAAAEKLATDEVDAIFISTDNTVVSALESVVKVANENQILLVCNDPASAKRGCAAALGLDYYDNGVLSVTEYALPILKDGKSADELPIQIAQKQQIALNLEAAQLQGVTLPQALVDRASQKEEKIVPRPSPTAGEGAAQPTATTAATPEADKPTATTQASAKKYVVGVVQQVTHPALDAARNGIEDAFKESGLEVELVERNAQNDMATLAGISEEFLDLKVDLVIAIGTQPLQSAYNTLKDSGIPIIFNTVANPYVALPDVIKSSSEHPGVTGLQALPPVSEAFDLILEFKPDAKKVGIIWTSNEKNSEAATALAREHAAAKGIRFIETNVTKADEVLAAAERLAGEEVDAIFISTDSTVVSALESVVKVANESQILLVCNDPASAKRGCAAALGLDYYDNGIISTLEHAVPILKGEKTVDNTPIKIAEKKNLALNLEAAQLQGVTIPAAMRSRADKDKIYETIEPKQ